MQAWRLLRNALAGREKPVPARDPTNPEETTLTRKRERGWLVYPARILIFLSVSALAISTVLGLLRWYQSPQVLQLLASYATAPAEPLSFTSEPSTQGLARLTVATTPAKPPDTQQQFAYDLLMIEFQHPSQQSSPDRSLDLDRSATLRVVYEGDIPDCALTWQRDILLPSPGQTLRLYFPVYSSTWDTEGKTWTRFSGIELPARALPALRNISRITNAKDLPLLITAAVSPETQATPPYQALAR